MTKTMPLMFFVLFAAIVAVAADDGLVLPAELVQSVSDAGDALANDNFAGYKKTLPAVLESVQKTTGAVRATLLPLSEKLVPGNDLTSARVPFKFFSNAVANFVAAQPKDKRQAKVFECPHALKTDNVFVALRWIQKDNPTLLNPFWGAKMLHCGKEIQ
jgi:hypothetical protein